MWEMVRKRVSRLQNSAVLQHWIRGRKQQDGLWLRKAGHHWAPGILMWFSFQTSVGEKRCSCRFRLPTCCLQTLALMRNMRMCACLMWKTTAGSSSCSRSQCCEYNIYTSLLDSCLEFLLLFKRFSFKCMSDELLCQHSWSRLFLGRSNFSSLLLIIRLCPVTRFFLYI